MEHLVGIETKHMLISLLEVKTKTAVYRVVSKSDRFVLGTIKWWGSWRQYCFFPNEETVFSKGCMNDLSDFIEKLMEHRKK